MVNTEVLKRYVLAAGSVAMLVYFSFFTSGFIAVFQHPELPVLQSNAILVFSLTTLNIVMYLLGYVLLKRKGMVWPILLMLSFTIFTEIYYGAVVMPHTVVLKLPS